MLCHSEKEKFLAASQKEFTTLQNHRTWYLVDTLKDGTQSIPLIWVFSYKFNTNSFLLKYKAQLCIRGDLQPVTRQDNYAAILAAKTFHALMAIMTAFDLEPC